jgi:nitrogen fixation protein
MNNIISILQYISPILGFIGTVLIYFFGVPKQIDNGGYGHVIIPQTDLEEIKKIKKYKFWGNTGLILIALGFLFNLLILLLNT